MRTSFTAQETLLNTLQWFVWLTWGKKLFLKNSGYMHMYNQFTLLNGRN